MRISDFRSFFDFDEFLVKKQEFADLLRQRGTRAFCNTIRERVLCGIVRNWINREPITAKIKNGNFVVNSGGEKFTFPLGGLAEQVDKYSSQLGFKDLYGLVALCILVGGDRKDSTFNADFGNFVNEKNGNDSGRAFVSLYKDTELPVAAPVACGCFRTRVFANLNSGRAVVLKAGSNEITLQEGQCVVAVFAETGCVALLPRQAADLPSLHAELVPDKANMRANLVVSREGRPELITGVTSVWIEPGAGVTYVTDSGQVVFNEAKCYKLSSRLQTFNRHSNDRKIIAIKKSENNNYVIYTTSQIDY